MSRLILIRHGQIAANASGHWHGATDTALTELGRRQAVLVGERLRLETAADQYRPVAVVASPLARTRHTASAIAQALGMPFAIENDLREYAIGELEGTHFQTLIDEHRFFERVQADHDYAPPGGESVAAVGRRVIDVLARLAARHHGGDVIVVGHGAAIGVALGSLLHADPTRWTQYGIKNCSLTELQMLPEPRVLLLNDVAHLG